MTVHQASAATGLALAATSRDACSGAARVAPGMELTHELLPKPTACMG